MKYDKSARVTLSHLEALARRVIGLEQNAFSDADEDAGESPNDNTMDEPRR